MPIIPPDDDKSTTGGRLGPTTDFSEKKAGRYPLNRASTNGHSRNGHHQNSGGVAAVDRGASGESGEVVSSGNFDASGESGDEVQGVFDDAVLKFMGKRALRLNKVSKDAPAPFPLDIFPLPLQRFITEQAECICCPVDFIANAVIVVASSFVGCHRPIEIRPGWQERSCIYALNIGSPGSRKSPALDIAMEPAYQRDKVLAKKLQHDKEVYKAKMKDNPDFDDPPPKAAQHWTTDTTVEGLADVLGNNPRGVLVYRDEAVAWVTSLNQYKGGKGSDRQFWLSGWSSQDYTINRKGKEPLRITSPFLSVIGNIPPDMLGELRDRRGREDGFIDRVLFSFPNPVDVRWKDGSPNDQLLKQYVAACMMIGELADATLKMTDHARQLFSCWFDNHNATIDGPAGSWAKMDGYCARLANVIHHLRYCYKEIRSRDSVDHTSVERAIHLTDYYKSHVRLARGCMEAKEQEPTFTRLIAYVLNCGSTEKVRPNQLIRNKIASNAQEAKAMLTELAAIGLGEIKQGSRKDETYFVRRDDTREISDPEYWSRMRANIKKAANEAIDADTDSGERAPQTP